jgi:hypothetical protein
VNTQMFSGFIQDRIRKQRADVFESAILEYKRRISIRNSTNFINFVGF